MALEALDKIAQTLQKPDKLAVIGGMAAEMIRGKIHKGDGFAPLSPAAAAYRGAGRPLQDTGALRDSITFKVIDEKTVSVGTNKPYAAVHHNGKEIHAKKNWLWIPAAGTRKLQRRYGYSVTDVLKGLKTEGYSIFRKGRTMCFREKRRSRNEKGELVYKDHVLYYLVKSVRIPPRPFFFLTERDMQLLMKEAGSALEQL
ncbi:MAG: phage virion morphogenesis protein [Treponema sp.]|jgi:phage gpG-like protein|nr:phage virion morphogenesis protein [Treponema sp.]